MLQNSRNQRETKSQVDKRKGWIGCPSGTPWSSLIRMRSVVQVHLGPLPNRQRVRAFRLPDCKIDHPGLPASPQESTRVLAGRSREGTLGKATMGAVRLAANGGESLPRGNGRVARPPDNGDEVVVLHSQDISGLEFHTCNSKGQSAKLGFRRQESKLCCP